MKPEDLQEIAKQLIRYAPAKPKLGMDRLLKIELFRNNFSKSTIYNMCIGTRRLIKDGHRIKSMPKELTEEILRQIDKPAQPQQPEPAMAVPMTPYEKFTKLKADIDKTNEFIEKQIADLEQAKADYAKSCDDKIFYWRQQHRIVAFEYTELEREILKQGTYDLLKFINEK